MSLHNSIWLVSIAFFCCQLSCIVAYYCNCPGYGCNYYPGTSRDGYPIIDLGDCDYINGNVNLYVTNGGASMSVIMINGSLSINPADENFDDFITEPVNITFNHLTSISAGLFLGMPFYSNSSLYMPNLACVSSTVTQSSDAVVISATNQQTLNLYLGTNVNPGVTLWGFIYNSLSSSVDLSKAKIATIHGKLVYDMVAPPTSDTTLFQSLIELDGTFTLTQSTNELYTFNFTSLKYLGCMYASLSYYLAFNFPVLEKVSPTTTCNEQTPFIFSQSEGNLYVDGVEVEYYNIQCNYDPVPAICSNAYTKSNVTCNVDFPSPPEPTSQPSSQPSVHPSTQPSRSPSVPPTAQPTSRPSTQPYSEPSTRPSGQPSASPTSTGNPSSAGLSLGGTIGVVVASSIVFVGGVVAALFYFGIVSYGASSSSSANMAQNLL